jgi:hypothetical protein
MTLTSSLKAAVAALALCAAAPAAMAQNGLAPEFSSFSRSNATGGPSVDYQIWTDLLRDIVYDVGQSDREPPAGRPILTGTRINTGNDSRYRYEGNRVVYHLMSDEYENAISEYRRDLETLPERVDFARLSSDEQLAYWMNLHNVAVIEQLMLEYPVTRVNRVRINGEPLYEAKILTVAGVPLSLNDIRMRIVYEQWNDPLVIYGFFNGAVGSPNILRNAYTGDNVWTALGNNAAEFINSLRGIEIDRNELEVSVIYADARPYFFPDWGRDLRAHLSAYAIDSAHDQLRGNLPIDADVEAWEIADLINGSSRCTGGVGDNTVQSWSAEGLVSSGVCGRIPQTAQALIRDVEIRRLELIRNGTYGRVYVRDIPTDDPDTEEDESLN